MAVIEESMLAIEERNDSKNVPIPSRRNRHKTTDNYGATACQLPFLMVNMMRASAPRPKWSLAV